MGSNLRRRGGVWWFRRRVPDGLHARLGLAEISRSLRTSSFMTARARAKRLWPSTDSLFVEMSNNPSLTEKQAKLILDQLAGEPLFASPTADDLVASVVQGDGSLASLLFNRTALDLAFSLPDEQRQVIAGHLARITDRMEAGVARLGQTVASERAGLAGHIASRERKRADEAEAALRQSKMAAAVQAEVNARLTELAAARPAPPASAPVIPAPVRPPGPSSVATGVPQIQSDIAAGDRGDTAALEARRESRAADAGTEAEPHRLSGFVERFFRAKQYRGDVEQQSRTTIRMWIEVNGDLAPRRYTEEHAFAFQDALRQLPSSHGKGGHVPVRKAIEKARVRPEKPRLKEKTIERHFSTMKQFWEHIGKRSADQSIFDGIQHKVIESQRWPWTEDALDKLLRARWNPSCRPDRVAQRRGTTGREHSAPNPVCYLNDTDIVGASKCQHPVQGGGSEGNLGRLGWIGARSKGIADHTFVSSDRRFDLGSQIVPAGFLPGHLAAIDDHPQMPVALCRSGFCRRTRHRAGAWRHDDGGVRMTLGNSPGDLILIVAAVGGEGSNGIGDPLEQSVSHRGIVDIPAGHRDGDDLAAGGIDADMQLPPGSTTGRSVLFDQPFACSAEPQARAVHQKMERAGSGSPEVRQLQRLRPPTQRRVVRHREIKSKQSNDGTDQSLSLPQRQTKDHAHRQGCADRQRRVVRLAAWRGSRLRPPRLDRLVGKPNGQATPLPQ
jgi:hypothetical protein